jgi:hypothetical protein
MRYYGKMIFYFSLICLSLSVYGENTEQKLSVAQLPANIADKSPEEQADLLSQIAEFSYLALLGVPETGLKTQRQALEELIAIRKWLEARQLPLFQLLALRLQASVDQVILNEMARKAFNPRLQKMGEKIQMPVQAGSFDQALVERFLQLNEIAEKPLIEFVVGLEGKIAKHCVKQNYPNSVYLEGLILKQIPTEMKDYVYDILHRYLEPIGVSLSQQQMADFLFAKALLAIDNARDVRLLSQIYFEGGFQFENKLLEKRLALELSKHERRRLGTRFKSSAIDVLRTLEIYMAFRPLNYGRKLTFVFLPFLKDFNSIEDKYYPKDLWDRLGLQAGKWLTFSETEAPVRWKFP